MENGKTGRVEDASDVFMLLKPTSDKTFAAHLDSFDELASFQNDFQFPTLQTVKEERNELVLEGDHAKNVVYLAGNLTGLLSRRVTDCIRGEITAWANLGSLVHGHGKYPRESCENVPIPHVANLFGCSQSSVAVMDNLPSNIHSMLSTFYQPTASKFKIAVFPQNCYSVQIHIEKYGFEPQEALLSFGPRQGEDLVRLEDILAEVEKAGDSLATVFMSAVDTRTGQVFDLAAVAEACHRNGVLVGFDISDAVGNVPLSLDEWRVDFACASSSKYLNSLPGGLGLCYVNRRHFDKHPRLFGWFGHRIESRFEMNNQIELAHGASGFKTGSQSPMLSAALDASLELFTAAGMGRLRKKSVLLTFYLEWLIANSGLFDDLELSIRPRIISLPPKERGCQLSIRVPTSPGLNSIAGKLLSKGVICNCRQPDIIQVAPVPMYNSFTDVYNFAVIFHGCLQSRATDNTLVLHNSHNQRY